MKNIKFILMIFLNFFLIYLFSFYYFYGGPNTLLYIKLAHIFL